MSNDARICAFLRSEISSGRCDAFNSLVTSGRNTAVLTYRIQKAADDAAGILYGMGVHIKGMNAQPGSYSFEVSWTIDTISRRASVACEACAGFGAINNETCWHCDGEGIDPTA